MKPKLDLSSEILDILPPTMRIIRSEMRGLASPELTVAQFRILTRLQQGQQSNKQLAEWMGISPATLCRIVDNLVRRGFVSRQHSQKDRREVVLVLTMKGKKKYEMIKLSTGKMLQKKMSQLSVKERQQLLLGLAQLKKVFLS